MEKVEIHPMVSSLSKVSTSLESLSAFRKRLMQDLLQMTMLIPLVTEGLADKNDEKKVYDEPSSSLSF